MNDMQFADLQIWLRGYMQGVDSRIAALEAEVRELKKPAQTIHIDMPDKTALELLQQRFPGVVPCKE